MPIEKAKSELQKLNDILREDLIADPCTASDLQEVHDQFQQAILSGDPAGTIREKNLTEQLIAFEESSPTIAKAIRDFLNALSGMGI